MDVVSERIRDGKCVLFLGAGASKAAGGPLADELAEALRKQFSRYNLPQANLRTTVDLLLAQPGADRADLENFVADRLTSLSPSYGHFSMTTFRWSAIFTTNYDRIVEKAYETVKQPAQRHEVVTHFEQPVTLGSQETLTVFKLHGSIDLRSNPKTPIVMSSEDYYRTRENRDNLLQRLKDLQRANTWIFAGYSFEDGEIFELLQQLRAKFGSEYIRWSYAIMPSPNEAFVKYLEGFKIVPMIKSFDDFFRAVEGYGKPLPVPTTFDILRKKYQEISPDLVSELDIRLKDLDEDYEIVKTPKQPKGNAHEFYRGNEVTWDDLAEEFDVRRDLQAVIEGKIREDIAQDRGATLYLVTSAAGSGKTTLIKRVAFDVHRELSLPIVRVKPMGKFRALLLERVRDELHSPRVVVLADDAESYPQELRSLFLHFRNNHLPFTFIAASRKADWNTYAAEHRIPVTEEVQLNEALSDAEVERFLNRLEHHKLIKVDRATPLDHWRTVFKQLHDKQILVIMRETVEGGHFDEVILNEYTDLGSDLSRDAYRITAAVHRFGLAVPRELLKRMLFVTWNDFFQQIVAPQTERIIVEEFDEIKGLGRYRARHRLIAKVLTDILLDTPSKWDGAMKAVADSMMPGDREEGRLLSKLLLNEEFRGVVTGPQLVRDLYLRGIELFPSYSPFFHQLAMFERDQSNIEEAERLLVAGRARWPDQSIFDHSLAMLRLRQADRQASPEMETLYLQKAEESLREATRKDPASEYGYHSLGMLYLRRARVQNESADRTKFLGLAMDIADAGLQKVPEEHQDWLKDLKAEVLREMGDAASAITMLRKSVETAPSSYSYLLLINLYQSTGSMIEASRLAAEAVKKFPNDSKLTHLRLELMQLNPAVPANDLVEAFKKAVESFPDNLRYRFEYACALYEAGRVRDARTAFDQVRRSYPDDEDVYHPRRRIRQRNPELFKGSVVRLQGHGVLVQVPTLNDTLYVRLPPSLKSVPVIGDTMSFEVWFNLIGPVGLLSRQHHT